MNQWAQILIPGVIGAVVAGLGHLVSYGRFEQRQDEHERRIELLERNQIPITSLLALKELLETKLDSLASILASKLDVIHLRLDAVVERRVAQVPAEQDRRVS